MNKLVIVLLSIFLLIFSKSVFSEDKILPADGFISPMSGASDYKDEGDLRYNSEYSKYYVGDDTENKTNFSRCEENNDKSCKAVIGTWKNTSDVGNYYEDRSGLHPAEDWNLSTGGPTDLGEAVQSIANGEKVRVDYSNGKNNSDAWFVSN